MRLPGVVWAILMANQLTAVGQPALAQVTDSSSNVKAVMKAEQTWWKGEITGDTIPMARLMAPNYESFYHGQGAVDRGELLGMIRPDTAGEHEELSNWKIRDYGSTAVATADYRITQGDKIIRQMTVVDVWSRERGTWKLVFSTGASVSPPDSAK
jgi:hypothetical protein